MKRHPYLNCLLLGLALVATAHAANTPCSGKKGGVARCVGGKHVCNDGSISASKKVCTLGAASPGRAAHFVPSASGGQCACSSGRYCTGPRGGHYCLTPSGRKSYLPRD